VAVMRSRGVCQGSLWGTRTEGRTENRPAGLDREDQGQGSENRQPAPSFPTVTEHCGNCEGDFIKAAFLGQPLSARAASPGALAPVRTTDSNCQRVLAPGGQGTNPGLQPPPHACTRADNHQGRGLRSTLRSVPRTFSSASAPSTGSTTPPSLSQKANNSSTAPTTFLSCACLPSSPP